MNILHFCVILLFFNIINSVECTETLSTLGCFALPNETGSILSIQIDSHTNGAIECVRVCQNQSYAFAGIVAGTRCYCGSAVRGQSSDDCSISCSPDSQNLCGGFRSISIYHTEDEVPGPPEQLRIVESNSTGMHLSWRPPKANGNQPVLQYEVSATPIETKSSLEPPGLRTWSFGSTTTSTWLYGVHPATFYSIEVRATNKVGRGTPAHAEVWTSIDYPPTPLLPELLSKTPNTMSVKLHMITPTNGPITAYRVVVVDESVGVVMNPSSLTDYYNATRNALPYYVTAEFSPDEFISSFTVGDSKTYRGYFNAPLKEDPDYHILLGAVSKFHNVTLSSYSHSDHRQHGGSNLLHKEHSHGSIDENRKVHHFGDIHVAEDHSGEFYSSFGQKKRVMMHEPSRLVVGLSAGVGVLGCLVLIAVVAYIFLRVYLPSPRRSDNQELTADCYDSGELQPDGMGHYMPDEDLPDHYSRLKQRVAVLAPADLTIVGDLGQGTFGAVKKGVIRSGRQVHSGNHSEGPALVHRILDASLESPEKAAMLRTLGQHISIGQHKHVVALLGLVEEVMAVSLAFEYYSQTLKQLLTESRALTHYPVYAEKHHRFSTIAEQQVFTILCGVARGLQWLRCCGVAHGAVCARNIVLVDGTIPKVAGFGLLHYTNDLHVPDYRRWVARELFTHYSPAGDASHDIRSPGVAGVQTRPGGGVCSLQGDVWSFGVLIWESVTLGATPYPELRTDDLVLRVQTGLRPPQPQHVGDDLYQVMLDCWQLDPSERPDFPHLEAILNQLSGEGTHLLFTMYPAFQYNLYAPHLEFKD